MKNRISKWITALVLLLAFALSGCGAQNSFLSAVKDGNYSKAIELYEKNIVGNSGRELKARDELQSFLENAWDSYVKGSMTDREFREVFYCMEEINDHYWIIPALDYLEYEFGEVSASKANYASGKASMKSGDYEAAVLAFEQVIPEDTEHYQDAVQAGEQARNAFIQDVAQNARTLATSGSCDEAVSLLDLAGNVVGYNEQLQSLSIEIATDSYAVAVANAYRSGDWLSAVRYYEAAMEDPMVLAPTAEMTQMYSESSSSYIAGVRGSAQAAFGTGRDFDAAIRVVQNALGEASFSSELRGALEQMEQEYVSYAPIALTSLDPVRKGEYIEIGDHWTASATYTDINGKTYDQNNLIHPLETEFSLASESAKEESECSVTYMLNYQYSTLSGTVFRPYGTLSFGESWNEKYGHVRIYGDGVQLYDAGDITDTTWEAKDFTLNVSGVRELTIVTTGRWSTNGMSLGIYERHPKVCVAELMLQK